MLPAFCFAIFEVLGMRETLRTGGERTSCALAETVRVKTAAALRAAGRINAARVPQPARSSRCAFVLGLVALVLLAPSPVLRGATDRSEEAYLWQRARGSAVTEALARGASLLDGFHVLAAEISWSAGELEVERADRDWAALAELGKPVGLVLRIGPYAGPFAADDATARRLAQVAAELLTAAQRAGVAPSELQIDFDCAESKLEGYGAWLQALRRTTDSTRLVITVLPSWMNARAAFARLVAKTDGFVLQVHSLERPTSPDEPFALCDPGRARRWVAQAAEFATTFRVALPTYGYLLNFDAAGTFVSLSAESAGRPPPTGGRQRVILSDARTIAELARELRSQPPSHCAGIIWFRLPVDGDQLNWGWPTFAKVIRGETLASTIELSVAWPEPALAEIVVGNTGDVTESIASTVECNWPAEAALVAADALAGFRVRVSDGRRIGVIEPTDGEVNRLIAPGERRIVAWFRFNHATDLAVRFTPSP